MRNETIASAPADAKPRADQTCAPRRRSLLLALAGATALPAAAMAKPADPDSRLIALCRTFLRTDAADKARWNALSATASRPAWAAYEARFEAINAQMESLARQIAAMPPSTNEGRMWKARCALAVASRDAEGRIEAVDMCDRLAWALVADIAAERGIA